MGKWFYRLLTVKGVCVVCVSAADQQGNPRRRPNADKNKGGGAEGHHAVDALLAEAVGRIELERRRCPLSSLYLPFGHAVVSQLDQVQLKDYPFLSSEQAASLCSGCTSSGSETCPTDVGSPCFTTDELRAWCDSRLLVPQGFAFGPSPSLSYGRNDK